MTFRAKQTTLRARRTGPNKDQGILTQKNGSIVFACICVCICVCIVFLFVFVCFFGGPMAEPISPNINVPPDKLRPCSHHMKSMNVNFNLYFFMCDCWRPCTRMACTYGITTMVCTVCCLHNICVCGYICLCMCLCKCVRVYLYV